MKRVMILCVLLMIFAATNVFAQKKAKETKAVEVVEQAMNADNDELYQFNRNIFVKSMKYYDYGIATMALYNMIELRPEKTQLKDTLALLYFNQGGHAQCKLVGEEILATNPQNITIREIVAISEQSLGMYKDALEEYEMLYTLSQDVFHLYQVATLQYSLQRYGECNLTLDKIMLEPEAGERKININTGKDVAQDVPISAAALNMKGVISLELNKKEEAIGHFNKALEIYPEFGLAKANIDQINNPE